MSGPLLPANAQLPNPPPLDAPSIQRWAAAFTKAVNHLYRTLVSRIEEAIQDGLAAGKPAAAGSRRFFFETDTKDLYYDDGTWEKITGGGSSSGTVPIGGIIMWSGTIATIPVNWALCDGTANAPGPDLRDKFVVGATSDSGGVAKTNLTGALTQSGGSVSHHHADHTLSTNVAVSSHAVTQPVVSSHTITQPVVSSHSVSVTQPVVSTHTITQPVVSTHTITQPVISTHTITQPVVSSHTITQPVIASHTLTTNVNVTQATAASAASGTTRNVVVATSHAITQPVISTHSLSTSVAVADHSLSTSVAIANHTLSTNVAIADHSLSTSVAIASHTLTTNVGVAVSDHTLSTSVAIANHTLTTNVAVGDHTITQPVVAAHDTLSAPQPYFALAYIQRMA